MFSINNLILRSQSLVLEKASQMIYSYCPTHCECSVILKKYKTLAEWFIKSLILDFITITYVRPKWFIDCYYDFLRIVVAWSFLRRPTALFITCCWVYQSAIKIDNWVSRNSFFPSEYFFLILFDEIWIQPHFPLKSPFTIFLYIMIKINCWNITIMNERKQRCAISSNVLLF